MAVEQDWAAYADQAFLALSDTLLARTPAGAGVEVQGADLLARRAPGLTSPFSGSGDIELYESSGAVSSGRSIHLRGSVLGVRLRSLLVSATTGNEATNLVFENYRAGAWLNRATLDYDGNFMLNTATASARMSVVSSASNTLFLDAQGVASNLSLNKTSTAGGFGVFTFNGTVVGSITTSGTATAYNTSSDYRLKEDLQAVEGALSRLLSVPVWNFAWKSTGARTDGFMAHELAEVVPCAVTGEKDGMQEVDVVVEPERVTDVLGADGAPVVIPAVIEKQLVPAYQGIDQAKLVPLLTAAVQELAAIVDEQRAEIAALKTALC